MVSAQTSVGIDEGGGLVIDSAGASDDDLQLRFDGNAYVVSNTPGAEGTPAGRAAKAEEMTIPAGSVTRGPVVVKLGGGDDLLTIDLSTGDLPIGVHYEGGDGGFDTLAFTAGARRFERVTFEYLNSSDGSVEFSGNPAVHYRGLEPITSIISATSVTLNYSTASETVTITDAGGGQTTVNSTAGELVTFNSPSGSLGVNAGDTGDDTIDVDGLPAPYPADVTIDGQGGTDTINLNGGLSFSGGLSLTGETINLTGALSPTGVSTFTGNLVAAGSGDLRVDLNGTTPGTDFDQLDVGGSVTLDGALTTTFGFTPGNADSFVVIDNDGADPVSGTFTGLAEGALVTTLGGIEVTITYAGGDGNDVVLLAAEAASPPVPVELESFEVDGR